MNQYPIPDKFFSNSAKHCTSLFVVDPSIGKQPTEYDDNATLTFVKYNGKTYGITCKHVVTNKENTSFATLNNHKYLILNRFICPSGEIYPLRNIDIAIRQIHPDFPRAIGKTPINLEQNNIPNFNNIHHTIAVGYPTKEKRRINAQNGYYIEMPCIHALAETSINTATDQLSLRSELDQAVYIKNFNGMSGGPVFWSTEETYGLLGIIYEALPLNPPAENSLGGGQRIVINAELVTPERFKKWLAQSPVPCEDYNWIKTINLNVYSTP